MRVSNVSNGSYYSRRLFRQKAIRFMSAQPLFQKRHVDTTRPAVPVGTQGVADGAFMGWDFQPGTVYAGPDLCRSHALKAGEFCRHPGGVPQMLTRPQPGQTVVNIPMRRCRRHIFASDAELAGPFAHFAGAARLRSGNWHRPLQPVTLQQLQQAGLPD